MARCKAHMVVEAENARMVEKAIVADNPSYVRTRVEGNKVIIEVESDTAGSMLATLDDLLVNLKVADELLEGQGTIEGQED
ncbi:KEOPS complex subunit Pcc1 [Methanocella sp. MCL-LM]|uniref:KEOPS complex subunit Pcc1 n=1 Tax=Methanocella sp. MCL-LM TaxID=3412035 RepID=UPI003C789358